MTSDIATLCEQLQARLHELPSGEDQTEAVAIVIACIAGSAYGLNSKLTAGDVWKCTADYMHAVSMLDPTNFKRGEMN